MSAPLLTRSVRWVCPNCDVVAIKEVPLGVEPGGGFTEFHTCAGLSGLKAPMVPAGTRCKVTPIPREDYLGTDIPRTDDEGRVFQSVVVERDDGRDCAVLAPTIGKVDFSNGL